MQDDLDEKILNKLNPENIKNIKDYLKYGTLDKLKSNPLVLIVGILIAVKKNKTELVENGLKHLKNSDFSNDQINLMINQAIKNKNEDMAVLLMEKFKESLSYNEDIGVIGWCVEMEWEKMVKFLVKRSSKYSNDVERGMDVAIIYEKLNMVEIILPKLDNWHVLKEAIRLNKIKTGEMMVNKIIAQEDDYKDENFKKMMYIAVEMRANHFIDIIFEHINPKDYKEMKDVLGYPENNHFLGKIKVAEDKISLKKYLNKNNHKKFKSRVM